MDFDTLITIGVIIYIIYSVKKAFSSVKKENTNQKSSGWAGKLGDVINNIKEEIEKANKEAMATQPPDQEEKDNSFWEDIREPSPKTISQTLFYEPKKNETPPTIEKKIKMPEVPVKKHRKHHGTHEKPVLVTARQNSKSGCFNIKRADLKKAVIWSEIISKPVGLRDE